MRISKDPEARKDELIEAAERLFLEKGYDSTAVGDIVRAVGVAQGTFYYHFKSKEDILGAIIVKSLETVGQVISEIVARTDLTAPEKLSAVIGAAFETITEKQGLLESLHRPGNALDSRQDEEDHDRHHGPPHGPAGGGGKTGAGDSTCRTRVRPASWCLPPWPIPLTTRRSFRTRGTGRV